jgi:hypothetical protein
MGGTLNDIIAHETAQNTATTGAIGQFAGALGKAGAPGAATGFGLNNLGIGLGDLTGSTAGAAGAYNTGISGILDEIAASAPEFAAAAV